MDALVTDLHWAVRSNEVGIIKRLLAEGNSVQSPDPLGRTPVHWAIVLGHEEVFKALLLNTSRHLIDMKDKLGRTPFHYACAAGKTDFASILIKRGASLNARDSKGRTPLHYAAQNVQPDMVELLLNRGANKDMDDCNGARPWDLAIKWGRPRGFEVLRVDSTTEAPLAKVLDHGRISDDFGRDMAEIQKPNSCTEKQPPSLSMLLCEWKKAEEDAREMKKGAADALNEALKAWRDAETEAKLEKRRNMIHESAHFMNQVSSCSSAISYGFLCSGKGEAIETEDDGWGCTEWESTSRAKDRSSSSGEVETWEKVMEWRLGLRSPGQTQKEPWATGKDQAPGPPIEAI